MYVNLTDEIGVVDLPARQMTASWPVPKARVQNSMAPDEPNHRLFIATRNPPTFFILNTDTGKVVTSLPCVGVNDDLTFDAERKRIYVTGDSSTSVFEQRDADHYEHIADVPTGYRAKTSLYVPELNRLYIASRVKAGCSSGYADLLGAALSTGAVPPVVLYRVPQSDLPNGRNRVVFDSIS